MHIDYLTTPLGMVEIQASGQGITQVIFCGDQRKTIATNELITRCKQQLNQYFSGQRTHFDLPLDLQGTLFQNSIWTCLTKIPFGHTCSYRDIAEMIDNRKAVRAVGGANGRNPISIIVPCHRVIGSNGALTGYAGGIERKLWLLKHEGISIKGQQRNDTPELELTFRDVIACRQDKTQFLN